MQNVVAYICEKFHYNDRLRNDRALGNGKSDNNKNNKNNVHSAWTGDKFPGLKIRQRLLWRRLITSLIEIGELWPGHSCGYR